MKEEKHESIRKIVLEEWDKGNLVFADIDGLKSIKFDDFIKQPIEGMLYDINRSLPVILSMEDPKWVNDFATVKLLVHFYEQCEKLKEENTNLKDELLKSTPIPQYKVGDVCINKDGGIVTIVAIVADQYKYDTTDYPYERYEFFRAFENQYKRNMKDEEALETTQG